MTARSRGIAGFGARGRGGSSCRIASKSAIRVGASKGVYEAPIDGKLGAPIKGATLIGDGPTVLTRVTGIGNDMALDPGMGNCGKQGQWVPVGVGQPTVMIGGLTVGGAQAA